MNKRSLELSSPCVKKLPTKDARSQVTGFIRYGYFADKGEGFFKRGLSHFFVQHFRFFKIYPVLSRTWVHFSGKGDFTRRQGGGVNFSRFCADVFYGRPVKSTIS